MLKELAAPYHPRDSIATMSSRMASQAQSRRETSWPRRGRVARMGDAELLISLGRQVHRAWATSDVGRLGELLAEEYTHVDIFGHTLDRSSWLEYAAEPRTPGELAFHDEHVVVFDEVAVLTSSLSLSALPEASLVRLLQVWLRSSDGWRRRWYQATAVQPGTSL